MRPVGEAEDPVVRRLLDALGAERVRSDGATRHEYAMDASPCYVPPRAVVLARSEEDVVRTVAVCRDLDVPITPRAAGTSLSGAAIGPGVVLDTKGLSEIKAFDPGGRWVRVGPGVPLLELNAFLAAKGFRFPPNPGSQDSCRIGGMVGHNASGYCSVKYGPTREYVLGLRVVLADGTVLEAGDVALDGPEWRVLLARVPAFETIRRLVLSRADVLRASRRPVKKHSSGYDVWSILDGLYRGIFPTASLFVGSEGTLGIVTEVTLRVLPLPERRVTLLAYLDRFEELGSFLRNVLALQPSGLEAIDGDSLDLIGRETLDIPPRARAMVLVEFDEGDLEALSNQVAGSLGSKYGMSRPVEVAFDAARQEALWRARRAVFPTLLKRPGDRKPWGFVEDPIVAPDRVGEFIGFLAALARKHGTVAGIYGHVGEGNAHYRPLFNPVDPEDFERMRALREEFDEGLLDRFRGVPSAEHGIGRIRADVLPRVWGPEVYGVMRGIKGALDPAGILNPGVLFGSASWWESWGGLEARSPL